MDKYIYDENNGLWYELKGDYYIPCLGLPAEEERPIGIWGQRHKRFETLTEQMKQAQGTTEHLKTENALEWVGRMNNIRTCAMETVNNEIIYA